MNVLIWYKRDLRVQDQPALSKAAALGAVLPLFIVEPDYWRLSDTSARHYAVLAEALTDLRDQTARIGAPLVVRSGDAVEVLERMCRQHHIRHILSHEETGNGWTYARDRRVAAWARANGIVWEELPQSGVVRRLAHRKGTAEGDLQTQDWQLVAETLEWGNSILEHIKTCDLFILDEIGPFEMEHGVGLVQGLRIIDSAKDFPCVVVIRPSLMEEARDRWHWAGVLDISMRESP